MKSVRSRDMLDALHLLGRQTEGCCAQEQTHVPDILYVPYMYTVNSFSPATAEFSKEI